MSQYPALLIIVPLIASFVITAFNWISRKYCFHLAVIALGTSFYSSIMLLFQVLEQNVITYRLGGWPPPMGIEYVIDRLNAFVLVLITSVALINLFTARRKVEVEFPEKSGTFHALYALFVTGLLGITITGDAFNLYVLLEITALTGYALIGMGRGHAALAGLNYLIMGTIGASLYLLGVGYLYLSTGSLNMNDLSRILAKMDPSGTIIFALVFCLIGLFIKMALFPMHLWLPNAYSYSPPAASGVIAPLTTKVMIYVMVRLVFSVFSPSFAFSNYFLATVIVWIAILAIIFGSILALAQKNMIKMLTYIVIAEVGYMVGGFWLGNSAGMTGAILHIGNDALMTLCLFIFAGNILFLKETDRISDLQGLFRKMPISMIAFVTAALSIIGVPPTCGFFSKWYLIRGGIEAGQYAFVAALIFSSLVNVILFFRVFEVAFFEPRPHHGEGHSPGGAEIAIREAPLSMLIPLVFSAFLLILAGLYTNEIVTNIIQGILPY